MRNLYLVLLIQLLFVSCRSETDNTGVIDIAGNLNNTGNVHLSEVASSVTYIPLETNEVSILGRIINILYIDDMFLIQDNTNCVLIFDNKGKFIRKINRNGKGPEEYEYMTGIHDAFTGNSFYVSSMDAFIQYDLEGNYIRSVKYPQLLSISPGIGRVIARNLYLIPYSTDPDMDGPMSSIAIYNDKEEVIERYNHNLSSKFNPLRIFTVNGQESPTYIYPNPRIFQRFDKSVTINFPFSSAILHYTPQKGLDTLYTINFGEYAEKENTSDISSDKEIISLPILKEGEKYIFMHLNLRGLSPLKYPIVNAIYYKDNGDLVIIDNDSEILKNAGITDDLKSGPTFWPSSLVGNDTAIGYRDAIDFIDMASASDNKDIKDILNSLDENSNPVLSVVKFK